MRPAARVGAHRLHLDARGIARRAGADRVCVRALDAAARTWRTDATSQPRAKAASDSRAFPLAPLRQDCARSDRPWGMVSSQKPRLLRWSHSLGMSSRRGPRPTRLREHRAQMDKWRTVSTLEDYFGGCRRS